MALKLVPPMPIHLLAIPRTVIGDFAVVALKRAMLVTRRICTGVGVHGRFVRIRGYDFLHENRRLA